MRRRYAARRSFESDVPNAMLGVSNLADVMLVLAVGIMLALVLNWHINVGGIGSSGTGPGQMEEIEVSGQDVGFESSEDVENNPDLEVKGQGTVYVDRNTGKMYLVESE